MKEETRLTNLRPHGARSDPPGTFDGTFFADSIAALLTPYPPKQTLTIWDLFRGHNTSETGTDLIILTVPTPVTNFIWS